MTHGEIQAVLRQPIGFWTGEAHRRIAARLRTILAENALTQPQWWIVNHLESTAWERGRLLERLEPYNANEEGRDLTAEFEDLLERGLVRSFGERRELRITEQGTDALAAPRQSNDAANRRKLADVSDADFVTCIEVLRVVVDNLGGDKSLR